MDSSRSGPRRSLTLGLLVVVALSSACARRALRSPAPDGTEVAPFDVRDVDVAPKIAGCRAPLTWSRGIQTARMSGGGIVSLVVNAEGQVVPGSVGRRRAGTPLPPPSTPGLEQDVLTCTYTPGMKNGQPVAVHTTTWFFYP